MTTLQNGTPYWQYWLNRWFYPLLTAGILINASGLFLTILEPDGALYALIAKTIAQTGDFINLTVEGKDWLDKPHFPFWMAALSYKVFGINSFAYKLPALLFWAMGAWYTWKLGHAFYRKSVAQLSVLIYMTAAHLVISNNDVRAEPYLTGLIAGSVFHYYRALTKKISWHLVAGSLLAACAVMTKGPFVLITIGAGFIVDWMVKKDWKQFLHPRWWLALLLTGIFILPELYCLYRQFDAQPQKLVFGTTGVSGLRFFFWDSQFGRFFNTGPIKGSGDPFFYFHTLLWAFLPWSLLLYAAIGWTIKTFRDRQLHPEYINLGTVVISFLVFSLSRFQLPHYINILFPFFAILLAQYLFSVRSEKTMRAIQWVQQSLNVLLVLLVIVVVYFFRPPHLFLLSFYISVLVLGIYKWLIPVTAGEHRMTAVFGSSFIVGVLLYGFLNFFFYPPLLRYQSGSEAASYINRLPPGMPVGLYGENSYSFAFYLDSPVHYWSGADIQNVRGPVLVFTTRRWLDSLSANGATVAPLRHFPHFHISQLTGRFIDHRTRAEATEDYIVARVSY